MNQRRKVFLLIKAVHDEDEDDKTLRIIASTANTDRMGDIVEQSWLLENFAKNPVMLWGHDASTPPIGRAENVAVEQMEDGPALVFTPRFDEGEHNPLANTVAEQFRNGTLNAVSVGFRPGAVTPRSSLDASHPMHAATGMILAQNELLEISAVTIPANAEALAVRMWPDEEPEIEVEDLIAEAVKAAIGDLPALVLDCIRTDPMVREAIVGHIMAQPIDEPTSLQKMLEEAERGEVVSLSTFLQN